MRPALVAQAFASALAAPVLAASLSDLLAAADTAIDAQFAAELDASVAALGKVKAAAEAGFGYDRMLAAGNAEGQALIMAAVDALMTQTALVDRAMTALGLPKISFEGSDSLDNPGAIFQ